MTAIIEFKQVTKRFETQTVLQELNLRIEEGEIFVIVGPSGSGKTTSLKMINGLIEPTEGNIYFKDKRIKAYNLQKLRWQMGYVLQQIALFPTMSVKENIEVIPEMLGWKKERREARVDELLREVDLDPEQYRDRMPGELSGGQQQRIGIIRALAAEPDIMLMDEPFSALDPLSRTSLQDLVLTLHEKLGNTIVFVTHNMKEALKLGDRIAVMQEGRILQCDTPEVIQTQPKDSFIRAFFDEAKEGYETQTVAQLYAGGFFQKTMAEELPSVRLNAGLPELFSLMTTHDKVALEDEAGKVVGKVTSADVFRFFKSGGMKMDYDVIVLGSGPAGMAAAYGLKEAGQKVAVVESYLWGGTCPNYGCDPKKILMSAVEAQARGKALAQKGLVGETHINWEALLAFKKSYTDQIPTRQKGGLEEANIATYTGTASFVSPHALQVGEQILSAHQFLIATGQQARQLDIPGQEYLKNSTDFMALPHLPPRVAFVGAGYIAFELATIARAAGAEVHVIHHNDRPLKGFDEELVQELVAHLQEAGIVFHFDVSLSEVQKERAGYRLVASDFELETDLVIGATGRAPNLGALHLERAHVDYGKNGILVNEYLQTTQPHIYACGDVLAKEAPKLTPVASYEAKYAVTSMAKATHQPLTYPLLPTVVFGDYRLARIGISEKELAAEPTKYHSQLLDLHDWYTYFRIQDQKAKIKLVYDEADRLVAVTCFSSLADELINYFVLVLNKKISPAELSDYIFAYPGLANDLNYLL